MNAQEQVEQNVRILIGDLQIQLIAMRARITELETQLAVATPKEEPVPNGEAKPTKTKPLQN